MSTQIIIGVPGSWPTHDDIGRAVSKKSSGFDMTPDRLTDTRSGDSWAVEIYEHDHDLVETFEITSPPWLTGDMERYISLHTYTVYILSSGLSLNAAKGMLLAGEAIIKAGGFAVKMESAGLVHNAEKWQEFCRNREDPLQLYSCFVTLVRGDNRFYSCGMHNLGLPDASAETVAGGESAAGLVNSFNCYQLAESPSPDDGDTFRMGHASPTHVLTKRSCIYDDLDHPFHNPFGMWHLAPEPA